MKIYNKKDFLNLPEGTFFAKGVQCSFDGFCIKRGSLGQIDFFYTDLISIDSFDSGELVDRQEEMLSSGTSYPAEWDEMRDGTFVDEDIFLVFEKEDLLKIRDSINQYLANQNGDSTTK